MYEKISFHPVFEGHGKYVSLCVTVIVMEENILIQRWCRSCKAVLAVPRTPLSMAVNPCGSPVRGVGIPFLSHLPGRAPHRTCDSSEVQAALGFFESTEPDSFIGQ